MVSGNYNYQFIDWSHGPIGNEEFDHIGTLSTHLITPTISIGLSDYVNINYSQTIGVRSMGWELGHSAHHRPENSLDSYVNAIASLFGDGTLSIKYLLTNTGAQAGSRIFIGSGLVIPGKSILTADPYELNEDGTYPDHRHFSLSDGCYKANFELQYYIKNKIKSIFIPTFYGITFNYIKSLKESDYGYLAGDGYSGIASALFATKLKNNWAPKGVSLGLIYMKAGAASWNDSEAPNSEAEMFLPTIGLIWNHKKYGSFSMNIRYNQNEVVPEDANNNESTSFEVSVGYRKTLNYTIPWLYY